MNLEDKNGDAHVWIGSVDFLEVEREEMWHCRLVLGWVDRDECIVMHLDGDILVEQLSAANALLDGLRISPPGGGLPHGLDGVEVDGFNLKNLESFEYLNRRRILLEDAERGDPANPNWEGAHHWMGEDEGGTSGNSATDALRRHVAAKSTRAIAFAMGRRKAIEAKRAKGDKGGDG